MTKFFKKSKKPYFEGILGPFWPNLGEKKVVSIFVNIPIIYHPIEKSEKTKEPFQRKMPNWTPSREMGSNNACQGYS